jgi:hypothetical protein
MLLRAISNGVMHAVALLCASAEEQPCLVISAEYVPFCASFHSHSFRLKSVLIVPSRCYAVVPPSRTFVGAMVVMVGPI